MASDDGRNARVHYRKFEEAKMQTKTTRTELKELQDARDSFNSEPLVLNTSKELFNFKSLETSAKSRENSMFCSHSGSGYNFDKIENPVNASLSGIDKRIFILSWSGKPLTPCKTGRAKKMLCDGVAKVIWNKFGEFGIQMLIQTREFTPKVVFGQDWGSKFEGYSLISGNENILNVMLKLPDKKKLVKKLEERRRMRRARRFRNCRRRECRRDNRNRDKFIAPSQMQIINSRLKVMREFFKCYPISKVVVEDVKFNHRDYRFGKHFTTAEVGKKFIFDFIRNIVGVDSLILFEGIDTHQFREKHNLKKSSNKSSEQFYSHCVDSFVIALEVAQSSAEPNKNIIFFDDSYRAIRRRLHDTQYSKGNIRYLFSRGSFKKIRKGTICEFGQIVGGTKNQVWYCDFEKQDNGRKIYQKGKMLNKIKWLSHKYKIKNITGENYDN